MQLAFIAYSNTFTSAGRQAIIDGIYIRHCQNGNMVNWQNSFGVKEQHGQEKQVQLNWTKYRIYSAQDIVASYVAIQLAIALTSRSGKIITQRQELTVLC